MSQISAKLRRTEVGPAHWCPGCKEMHVFYVDRPAHTGARWTWDGNVDRPTFNPSMVVSCAGRPAEGWPPERCHYFLHAGRIQFLGDCTHALAGLTVDLPDLPAPAGSPASQENPGT